MKETDKKIILSALDAIPPDQLHYDEWFVIGAVLHDLGFPTSVWDEWSSRDPDKYKIAGPNSCHAKIASLKGGAAGAGRIINHAKSFGWTYPKADSSEWFNEILTSLEYYKVSEQKEYGHEEGFNQKLELLEFIRAVFRPGEYIGVVTNNVWQDDSGKWHPKGRSVLKYDDIIAGLESDLDIGFTIGTPNEEAGAYIVINPVDRAGAKDENVTAYRHVLVEADDGELWEQEQKLRNSQLPITCMTYSGGKSIHALVEVNAENPQEYRQRAEKIYDFLEKSGLKVDRQNINPSRLSRMPGVMRKGKQQHLICLKTGLPSWSDWESYQNRLNSDLPGFTTIAGLRDNPPELLPELIHGVLRRSQKMMIAGASKSGKTWAEVQLAIALATGGLFWGKWKCEAGPVIYINLEIEENSFMNRVLEVAKAIDERYGLDWDLLEKNLMVWNLRGKAKPLNQLQNDLIDMMKRDGRQFSAVIYDPIYKIITGDENSASDMGAFCNLFDRICSETGAAAIFAHHHSKGAQGGKRAIDRFSGSGALARDPDAIIDMTEILVPDRLKDGNKRAFRVSCIFREFEPVSDFGVWFDFPLHIIDHNLDALSVDGETVKSTKTRKSNFEIFSDTWNDLYLKKMGRMQEGDPEPMISTHELAERIGKSRSTIIRWINGDKNNAPDPEISDMYHMEGNMVFQND